MVVGKFLWGGVLAILFLFALVRFRRNAGQSPGVKYSRVGVLLSFSMVGLIIYLVFFRQI